MSENFFNHYLASNLIEKRLTVNGSLESFIDACLVNKKIVFRFQNKNKKNLFILKCMFTKRFFRKNYFSSEKEENQIKKL